MSRCKFQNYDIETVEKTIHYLRYNVEKDNKFAFMCYVTNEGKMEVQPVNESTIFTNVEDITTYGKLLTYIYTTALSELSNKSFIKEADHVMINDGFNNIKKAIVVSITNKETTAVLRTKYNNGYYVTQQLIEAPLSKLIPFNNKGMVEDLIAQRQAIIDKKAKEYQDYIDLYSKNNDVIMQRIKNMLTETAVLNDRLSKEYSKNREKALKEKKKAIRRLNKIITKFNHSINKYYELKDKATNDMLFNYNLQTGQNGDMTNYSSEYITKHGNCPV